MLRVHWLRMVTAAGAFALLAAFVPVGLSGATSPDPVAGPDCTPVLDRPLRGEKAIEALGANIERSADHAEMTPTAFARILRTDPTLWVDVCGVPFYVEPAITIDEAGAVVVGRPADLVPGVPLAEDPAVDGVLPPPEKSLEYSPESPLELSSRPGSLRTIYLDFTGATVSGTAWNAWAVVDPIVATPFSLDADGSTFTEAELSVIRGTWLRVAEDFAPFDVNVTTVDPGFEAINRSSVGDQTYGAVALFTNGSIVYELCGRCGGYAYTGVFDYEASAYYEPAWVFPLSLATNAKYMADAASHEVGHLLNLNHDGTGPNPGGAVDYYGGHGAWAPILGIGYGRPVTQWSKGEYAYANNTQDDLAVINAHGVLTAPDDHGDAADSATSLTAGRAISGVIGTATDTDWFTLRAGGTVTISVKPHVAGPNLDVGLRVYNSAGALVGSADPAVSMVDQLTATGLDATLNLTLNPDTYYVRVDGVGYGNPANTGYSDYGSLGRYDITLTVPPLSISTTTLPDGTALAAYSTSLTATGGTAPYTWAVSAGALPAGLALSAAGVISGTPTAPTTASFTVRVTDASGASKSKTFSLTVDPAPLRITTTSLPTGRINKSYSATLEASGGVLPYKWTRSSGSIPPGLTLSKAGVISGRPKGTGTYTFKVKVTDDEGTKVTKSLSLKITR